MNTYMYYIYIYIYCRDNFKFILLARKETGGLASVHKGQLGQGCSPNRAPIV